MIFMKLLTIFFIDTLFKALRILGQRTNKGSGRGDKMYMKLGIGEGNGIQVCEASSSDRLTIALLQLQKKNGSNVRC